MAVTAVTSNTQSAWQQLQLQQAQRNADRAALTARSLQAQASSAQASADQAQASAEALKSQASQAQSAAGQARLWLQTAKSLNQLTAQLNNVYTKVAQTPQQAQPAAGTQAPPQAQVAAASTPAPTLGTVVNTTA